MTYAQLPAKLKLMVNGIRVKLSRGEGLEEVLAAYTALSEEEKDSIRAVLGV